MPLITVEQLTTKDLNGTGIFDTLMEAVRYRLDEEYSSARIRGDDYANVYLNSMQSAMQQAIAFLLEKDKAGKQADLTDAQINKTNLESNLVSQQILEGVAQTALIQQNTSNATITADILRAQHDKLIAEIAFLYQKIKTEKAQIQDEVEGIPVTGTVGKQKALYQAQTEGFARDAEQKLAKILADSWSVRRSTDEGENPADTGLTNDYIKAVIDKAKAGINA